jgi:hypothetical protein
MSASHSLLGRSMEAPGGRTDRPYAPGTAGWAWAWNRSSPGPPAGTNHRSWTFFIS